MKLDVLSGLEAIEVCVAYELNGRRIDVPPAWAGDWDACRPVYETYEGWAEDVGSARRFEDLPVAAQRYVRALQDLLELPIEMISVGAERERFIPLERGIPVGA